MYISESAPKQTPHTLQRHPTVRLCAFSTQNSYYGLSPIFYPAEQEGWARDPWESLRARLARP